VCFYLVATMNGWFLEQRINIKLCIIFVKNACDICAILCEAYRGEAVKKLSVSESGKWLKEDHENMEGDERSSHPRSHRSKWNC
jgi:hypothetical protein